MTSSGGNIFAGTSGLGVFLSTNNGSTWTAVDSGFSDSNSNYITSLVASGGNIFAGSGYDVFFPITMVRVGRHRVLLGLRSIIGILAPKPS
jgi:hypothetical protein